MPGLKKKRGVEGGRSPPREGAPPFANGRNTSRNTNT